MTGWGIQQPTTPSGAGAYGAYPPQAAPGGWMQPPPNPYAYGYPPAVNTGVYNNPVAGQEQMYQNAYASSYGAAALPGSNIPPSDPNAAMQMYTQQQQYAQYYANYGGAYAPPPSSGVPPPPPY